jgi:glycosyltransferase involved in cell wall biosynthesis
VTRIAYLVSDYDAPSHTFIRREAAALQHLGADIVAFSIQPGSKPGSDVASVLGRSPWAYLLALIASAVKRPSRFFSTWNLALRHRPPGLRAIVWAQFHFVEALVLARLLSQAGASHLHVHFANSGATVAMLAADYLRVPWSLTLHGISETDFPAGLLLPEKITRAKFIACASYFMQAQAMRMVSPDQWHKFQIVRCGVDTHRLGQMTSGLARSDLPRLICVGRLSPEKGHLGLLEVISRLRARGIDCRLNLVGDGPLRPAIEDVVERMNLGDRVSLEGFLIEDDTLAAIASSDILVLPSFMEGLPVVLIEALAMGKPVVASRVAGIPELVEHGRSGLLFTPSDTEDLEEVLARILVDRTDWVTLGVAGKARVQSEYDSLQIAKPLLDMFSGALSSSSGKI